MGDRPVHFGEQLRAIDGIGAVNRHTTCRDIDNLACRPCRTNRDNIIFVGNRSCTKRDTVVAICRRIFAQGDGINTVDRGFSRRAAGDEEGIDACDDTLDRLGQLGDIDSFICPDALRHIHNFAFGTYGTDGKDIRFIGGRPIAERNTVGTQGTDRGAFAKGNSICNVDRRAGTDGDIVEVGRRGGIANGDVASIGR